MIEMLSQIDIPFHIIYTRFPYRNVSPSKVLSTNSITKLFNIHIEKLKEYNTEFLSEQEILQTILKNFERNSIYVESN